MNTFIKILREFVSCFPMNVSNLSFSKNILKKGSVPPRRPWPEFSDSSFSISYSKGISSILQKNNSNFHVKKTTLPLYFVNFSRYSFLTQNTPFFFCKYFLIPIEACTKKIKSPSVF